MEMLSPVTDDEREDGEIVDDDFEDISDYSIPSCGKSEYSKGLLRAISLSSISDSDGERENREKRYAYITLDEYDYRKRRNRRRSTMAIRKRRRDSSMSVINCNHHVRSRKRQRKSLSRSSSSDSSSSSSSSSDIIDQRTLKQLNKAVRIDSGGGGGGDGDELHHISLKDRLKRMIQPEQEVNVLDLRGVLDDSKIETRTVCLDESKDTELEELRLQALKSAMLKKHLERKRRKEMMVINNHQLNVQNGDLTSSNNKENTENNIISKSSVEETITKVSNENQDTIEDDLDIMRAMLLASMSKKITEDQPSSPHIESLGSSPIPPDIISINDKKKSNSLPAIKLPPVKPLIIQLNTGDSDSDSELEEAQEIPAQPPNPIVLEPKIQSSVEELLRKQREQFEAKLVEESKNKKQDDLDKSFLKLLPKSQQQEYKLLKQKLQQARKTNVKANEVRSQPQKPENQKDKRERLQTKGKYRELAPIIKKINAEVTARRKCEDNIKMLMEQLQKARLQLNAHQQRYTTFVIQLKTARKNIDLRIAKASNKPAGRQDQQDQTVATIKTTIPSKNVIPKDKGLSNGQLQKKVTTLRKDIPINVETQNDKKDVTKSVQNSAIEQIANEVIDDTVQEHRMDTIDDVRTESFAYVSPLDKRFVLSCNNIEQKGNDGFRENNNTNNNPLQMLCPYELFGVCKDKNCTFNHCP